MSKLTPSEIFNTFQNGAIDKSSAKENLLSIFKSNENDEIRLESFKFLMNLGFNLKQFKNVIRELESPDLLIEVYIYIESLKPEQSKAFLNAMEEIIGKEYLINYDLSAKEAMALELLGQKLCKHSYSKIKRWSFSEFYLEVDNKKVLKLIIELEGNTIDSRFFKLFLNLRILKLIDCKLTDYSFLTNLISLNINGSEEHVIDNIDEIRGLEKLTNLEELNLSGNGITEIKNLKKLINLKKLNLSENHISEIKGLDVLINLESLNLSFNSLSEIKGLDKLINLRELDLSGNENITEIKGLDSLNKLEYLNFSEDKINRINNLNNLVNLRHLNLYKADPILMGDMVRDHTEKLRDHLMKGRDIRDFHYYDNEAEIEQKSREFKERYYISEIGGLENLNRLEELDLRGNNIKEIKGLEKLKNLRILKLDYNNISEIKGLEQLNNLEFLSISNNDIEVIPGLPSLGNESVGVNNPQKFVKYCKQKKLRTKMEDIPLMSEGESKALRVLELLIGIDLPLVFSLNKIKKKNGIYINDGHIKGINLSNCGFEYFPEPLTSFNFIEYLDLKNNELSDFPSNLGEHEPFQNLLYLNISGNNISLETIQQIKNSFYKKIDLIF